MKREKLNNLELMVEALGETREGKNTHTHKQKVESRNLIERKLLVAFSCEIEHVPHTDVQLSSGFSTTYPPLADKDLL